MSVRAKRITLLVGAVATIVAATACTDPESDQTGSSSSITSTIASTPATTTAAAPPSADITDISDASRQDLCTRIEGTLSDWRVQGPTLGTPALNILVQEWAFQNGGLALNARLLNDRSIPDAITTATCPDVRRQAIEALNLPDLASGLAGLR